MGVLRYLRRNYVALIAIAFALGGTAYAAAKFDSGDVKNKSLKGKDFKPGTLTGAQFKAETLTGADVNEADLAGSRVVARLRNTTDQTVPRTGTQTLLSAVGPWTQRADEVNEVSGRFVMQFPAACNPPRTVQVFLVRPPTALPLTGVGIVAVGLAQSNTAGAQTVTSSLASTGLLLGGFGDPGQFEPGAETQRSLNAVALAGCAGGSTADPVITDLDLNVIGHR